MRLIDADSLETHERLEPFGNGNYEYVEIVYKDDIDDAPTIKPEREILDELIAIMKEYYFTHRDEYNNEAWENGFAKCMNLIPNVYMKRGKDR